MSQGARPEFQCAIHPTHDVAFRQVLGHAIQQAWLVQFLHRHTVFPRQLGERIGLQGRAPEGMVGKLPVRIAEVDSIGIQRCTHGTAGIARRGWNKYPLEAGLLEDAVVGDAIQGHAAAQAQVGQSGLTLQRPRHFDQYVFQNQLNACGAVGEASPVWSLELDGLVPIAGRSEDIDEALGK